MHAYDIARHQYFGGTCGVGAIIAIFVFVAMAPTECSASPCVSLVHATVDTASTDRS